MKHISTLCGGVGGAKLALGLAQLDVDLTLVVNTGDDFDLYGLPICPDIDTVLYTLSAKVEPSQGWGRAEDSLAVQKELEALGETLWFKLGDRDIALHLLRAQLLANGFRLAEATREIGRRFGIRATLVPMCDAPAPTTILCDEGELPFQEYFVARQCAPAVREIRYGGVARSPSPEALAALENPDLDGLLIGPSNPLLSIAPILAVQPLRRALEARRVPAIAVTPIIAGAAVKGPTAKIFAELNLPVDAIEVARQYAGLIDAFVLDTADANLAPDVRALGIEPIVAPTLMKSLEDRVALAHVCVDALDKLAARVESAGD
jgi:LPPG:FO 2-phospho-L-lactate transferase